jgi:hypothetical protein
LLCFILHNQTEREKNLGTLSSFLYQMLLPPTKCLRPRHSQKIKKLWSILTTRCRMVWKSYCWDTFEFHACLRALSKSMEYLLFPLEEYEFNLVLSHQTFLKFLIFRIIKLGIQITFSNYNQLLHSTTTNKMNDLISWLGIPIICVCRQKHSLPTKSISLFPNS